MKAHAATVGRDKERITVQREIMAARAAGALFNIEHGGLAPDRLTQRELKLQATTST